MAGSGATQIPVLSQGRAAVYEEPTGQARIRVRELPRTEPPRGSVSVAIRAASINHLDLFLAQGLQRVSPPRVIAADGARVISASGDPAWKPGDEVVIYPVVCDWVCEWCRSGQNVRCPHFGVVGEHTDGTACEVFQIDARNVFRKPKALSWEEAGAFPLTFLTAWRMLTTRARLQAGEKVLIVGAGGGVAVAAAAIAKHLGAKVFVTSRRSAGWKRPSSSEKSFCRYRRDGRWSDAWIQSVSAARQRRRPGDRRRRRRGVHRGCDRLRQRPRYAVDRGPGRRA